MNKKPETGFPVQNTLIGFLSLLLAVLVFALVTRILYPRIINERSEDQSVLISGVIQLEILNGCGVSGLANEFTNKLRRLGFDVVETGNYENFNVSETFIVSRTDNIENARRIAAALGIDRKNVIIEESNSFYLDATLIIGSDFKTLNLE